MLNSYETVHRRACASRHGGLAAAGVKQARPASSNWKELRPHGTGQAGADAQQQNRSWRSCNEPGGGGGADAALRSRESASNRRRQAARTTRGCRVHFNRANSLGATCGHTTQDGGSEGRVRAAAVTPPQTNPIPGQVPAEAAPRHPHCCRGHSRICRCISSSRRPSPCSAPRRWCRT